MSSLSKLYHYLLPHESNNFRARVMHPSILWLVIGVLVVWQVGMSFFTRVDGGVLGYAANISPEEVIRLTNEKRIAQGLSALRQNAVLNQAAAAKGADMLNKDYWSHTSPDGTEPWSFFISAGYKYKYAGENLARDFSNPASAVEAWMASPTHKDNLLSDRYEEIGVAVIEGDLNGVDTTLIVQLFGTPLAGVPEVVAPVAAAVPPSTSAAEQVSLGAGEEVVEREALPLYTTNVVVSPFDLTRSISIILVVGLIAIIMADFVVISRRRVSRSGSKMLAHLAFFGMILIVIWIARVGDIL